MLYSINLLRTCQENIIRKKNGIQGIMKNAVTIPPKNTVITKPTIRDNSIKGTIIQESKKTTTVSKVNA